MLAFAVVAVTATSDECTEAIRELLLLRYVNPSVSEAMLLSYGLDGNDMGSYHRCTTVCTDSVEKAKRNCTGQHPATYCTLINTIFTQGVCVPSVCTEDDIRSLEMIEIPFKNTTKDLSGYKVHCGGHAQKEWTAGAVTMVVISTILALCVSIGTYLHLVPDAASPDQQLRAPLLDDSAEQQVRPRSCCERAFLVFSLKANAKALLERSPTRKYKALDGIRAISLLWIILAHTANFMTMPGLANPTDFYPPNGISSHLTFTLFIYTANLSVDSFFFLGAFLLTYVMVRKLEKGAKIPLTGSIIHRYLRLVPSYLFVMMFYMFLAPHMGEGPLWFNLHESNIDACNSYWWTNILFINNFYPAVYADQCLPWTWYLANDMQFFVVGVILILLLHNKPMAMFGTLTVLITASMVTTGILVANDDIATLNLADPALMQNHIYDKPWCRIPAYLIGMFTAMLFARTEVRIKSNKAVVLSYVLIFAFTFLPAWYFWSDVNPAVNTWTPLQNQMYLVLSRPMWTVGVAILTYLCVCGRGGFIDWFLSLTIWDPMAKLSYAAYLLHPMIIRIVYFNRVDLFFYSDLNYAVHFLAFAVLSYSVAAVVFCSIETPFASLENVVGSYLKGEKRKQPRV